MNTIHPADAARRAVSAHPDRPATAIVHDSPHMRMLVFRIAPGQEVKPHRSASTVVLTVLEGTGTLSGERDSVPYDEACVPGDVSIYAPQEMHGMRAANETLLLLATIAPRPGGG